MGRADNSHEGKQYIFTIDEAVEYVNQGRVKDITVGKSYSDFHGSTSGSMSYTRSMSYRSSDYATMSATFDGVSNSSSESKTALNKFWITSGMLKEFVSLKQLDAQIVDREFYFAIEDLDDLKKYYNKIEKRNKYLVEHEYQEWFTENELWEMEDDEFENRIKHNEHVISEEQKRIESERRKISKMLNVGLAIFLIIIIGGVIYCMGITH